MFANKNNPFAKAMMQHGLESVDNKISFPVTSKAYEKVWFYKDLEQNMQGPYNCIEMFNWTARKCFPDDLEISFCNTEFVPMNNYFSNLRKTASEKIVQRPKEDFQTKIYEAADANRNIKNQWGAVSKPIGSLKDIQKEQFISNNK